MIPPSSILNFSFQNDSFLKEINNPSILRIAREPYGKGTVAQEGCGR